MNVSRIVLADLLWQFGSSNEFEERVDPTDGMAEASTTVARRAVAFVSQEVLFTWWTRVRCSSQGKQVLERDVPNSSVRVQGVLERYRRGVAQQCHSHLPHLLGSERAQETCSDNQQEVPVGGKALHRCECGAI